MHDAHRIEDAQAPRAAPRPARSQIPLRRRILFALVISTLIAASQEVCFRLALPLPEVAHFNRSHYARSHPSGSGPDKRVEGVSNLVYRIESEPDGFSFDHTLNLYGFRGRDFAIAPPRDRPRVLFIGDSFVEGMGAADGDTIPVRFAEELGGPRCIDAINLGVIGASLADYARIARDSVPLLGPDAVFLVLYANDLPAPPLPAEADRPPAFARLNPFVPRAAQVVDRLRRGLPLPRRRPIGPFPFFRPVPSPLNPLTTDPVPEDVDPGILDAMWRGKSNPSLLIWARVVEGWLRHDFTKGGGAAPYLERIAEECRRAGAELSIVYIPASVAVHPAHLEAQKRLAPSAFGALTAPAGASHRAQQAHLGQVTDSLGIPLLDLTDAFIHAEATSGRMYWPIDTHCNAAGYRLVAQACARAWADPRIAGSSRLTAGRLLTTRSRRLASAHPPRVTPVEFARLTRSRADVIRVRGSDGRRGDRRSP